MTRLRRWSAHVERVFIPLLALSVLLALLVPGPLSRAHGSVLPLFAAMMLVVSLTFHAGDVGEAVRDPVGTVVATLLSLVPLALLAQSLSPALLGLPDRPVIRDLGFGLVLYGALPTDISAPLFTALSRGNTALAAIANGFITGLSPFVLPVWFLTLTGLELRVPTLSLILELVLVVLVPSLVGVGLRTRVQALERLDVTFEAVASLIYLALVAVVVAQEHARLLSLGGSLMWRVLGLVTAMNLLGYGLGALAWSVSRRAPRDLPAYVFVIGEREFSVAVAVVYAGGLSPTILVPATLAAVVQAVTAALLARIFRAHAVRHARLSALP